MNYKKSIRENIVICFRSPQSLIFDHFTQYLCRAEFFGVESDQVLGKIIGKFYYEFPLRDITTTEELQQFSIKLTTEINHQIKSRQGFDGLHT
jgi:hypothetical protein